MKKIYAVVRKNYHPCAPCASFRGSPDVLGHDHDDGVELPVLNRRRNDTAEIKIERIPAIQTV